MTDPRTADTSKVTCHHFSTQPAPETAVYVHHTDTCFVDVRIGYVENTVFLPRGKLLAWLQALEAKVGAAVLQLSEPPPHEVTSNTDPQQASSNDAAAAAGGASPPATVAGSAHTQTDVRP